MAEMWKPLKIEDYIAWIDLIVAQKIELNEWEQMFIVSVYGRLRASTNLSELQAKKLEDIYVRTS